MGRAEQGGMGIFTRAASRRSAEEQTANEGASLEAELQEGQSVCEGRALRRHIRVWTAFAAMAGGGHGAHNITHGGLSLHATKGWHSRVGQGMCAVMWFWVLYRAKQDGAVLMGWRHPWEGHGHGGHDDHEHGHEEAKHH